MSSVKNLRAWTWLCITAWLLMLTGPLLHAAGHEDDHVHTHGGVVHHHRAHNTDTPRDLIAQARLADLPQDDRAPQDQPAHGFDANAHFVGAAPLHAPPTITALTPLLPAATQPLVTPTPHHHATHTKLPPARGPPDARTLNA